MSIIRSQQVLQNTMHAIVAGVVSTWWFVPDEASSCCSKAIMGSTVRATTTSFGSICFGSLLVAIIQTLRHLLNNARNNDDMGGGAAFLLCLVDCCLQCFQEILEYFNKVISSLGVFNLLFDSLLTNQLKYTTSTRSSLISMLEW